MLPSIKLYSVYFNSFPIIPLAPYVVPIQAGANGSSIQLKMIGDDTGDHISKKNELYSELTALYWIYKNAPRDTDAIGICHYRRYLIGKRYKWIFTSRSRSYFKPYQETLDSLLTPSLYQLLQKLLSKNDVIVPHYIHSMKEHGRVYNIEEAYRIAHIEKDWEITMNVVREKFPGYARSIGVFSRQPKMIFHNVMIATWNTWDNYVHWLFEVLFEVEKQIDLPKQGYQKRVMGFLAERLLNLFIIHNRLKTASLTMGIFEESV